MIILGGFSPPQQVITLDLSISVEAGYDGFFRANQWLPLLIEAANNGGAVEGRLVVRPDRSRGALFNTFSAPLSLASGGRKATTLYVTPTIAADQLLVEFIDDDGLVLATEAVTLQSVASDSPIYIVLTQAASGAVDLSGVVANNRQPAQANWRIVNIPDSVSGLEPVNVMLFSDIDTGALTLAQQEALGDWVAQGGHLIVTGGSNWQGTAAGLGALLPFVPTGSDAIDDLEVLSEWLSAEDASALSDSTIITTGTAKEGALTLVAGADEQPILLRRHIGNGTVDYLTADPNSQPLRNWGGLNDFWLTLLGSTEPRPVWTRSFTGWEDATTAVEIIPGFSLLPSILPLLGFLLGYILLIGPLNYVVLNNINRREWAWVTIPVLIVAFTVVARVIGFNLRGTEATVNQIAVVQTWVDSDRARVDSLIGLLSPQRARYELSLESGNFLRPIPRTTLNTDIQQSDRFTAADFPVDASFIASFNATGMIERPEIGGQGTLFFDGELGLQMLRGSVRNDSALTLNDPVILARGASFRLNEPLAPGAVATFDLTLVSEVEPPAPAPIIDGFGFERFSSRSFRRFRERTEQTIIDILGQEVFNSVVFRNRQVDDPLEAERNQQRQLFLTSFLDERFGSTRRGNDVYLAGWTVDNSPLGITLEGADWTSTDSTLYIVELDIDRPPPNGDVLITAGQFTWFVAETNVLQTLAPVDLLIELEEEIVFRFTPIPDAVLGDVDELILYADSAGSTRNLPIELWNWGRGEWDSITLNSNVHSIRNPDRYLGPQNSVEVRIMPNRIRSFIQISRLAVEHRGTF